MGGAPKGERNGHYRHGMDTAEALQDRADQSELMRQARALMRAMGLG